MNDFLAVAIGVLLGVLASVPVAMVIAASTTPRPARFQDTHRTDVAVEPPTTAVVVFRPDTMEVL